MEEGIDSRKIYMVGSTRVYGLLQTVQPNLQKQYNILLTIHFRDNFDQLLQNVFKSVLSVLEHYPNIHIFNSLYPNSNLYQLTYQMLENYFRVKLLEQFDYFNYVIAMQSVYLIQTDSSGIQETGSGLRKAVLVLLELTERSKLVSKRVMKLLGSELNNITLNVKMLPDNIENY